VAAAAAATAVEVEAEADQPHLIRQTTLPSGVRLVTERVPGAVSASVGAYVGVGGRDEDDALAGASHFLEHLLFKGTATRSARQIAEQIDATGGDMNAYTSREHTAFYARVPARDRDLAVDVLAEVLSEPALRASEVDAEREVILEELAAAEDNPEDVAHMRLASAMYPGHPLGREVLGTEQSIEEMSREDIVGFHQRWYRPANLVVAAAGDVDHDELSARLSSFTGAGPGGEPPVRSAPGGDVVPVVVERHPVEQAHLCLGWHGPGHHDDDRYAFAFVNHVLGGGTSSRLFQEIREERGLAYTVFSSLSLNLDGGALTVYAATSPSKLAEVLSIVDDEVARLVASGITDDEYAVAIGYLEGSTLLSLEDPGSRMGRIGRAVSTRGEVHDIEEQLTKLRAVTPDDVNRVVKDVLGGPRSLVAVGPFDVLPG
jgi:predicted Zn-dependent peptidase